MGEFQPGIEFNRAFYAEVVGPILKPWRHSAALLGWGSEILGFDTERSTDHGWGPRLRVFEGPTDIDAARGALDVQLPEEFRGWPIRYGWDAVPVEHRLAQGFHGGGDLLGRFTTRGGGAGESKGGEKQQDGRFHTASFIQPPKLSRRPAE